MELSQKQNQCSSKELKNICYFVFFLQKFFLFFSLKLLFKPIILWVRIYIHYVHLKVNVLLKFLLLLPSALQYPPHQLTISWLGQTDSIFIQEYYIHTYYTNINKHSKRNTASVIFLKEQN